MFLCAVARPRWNSSTNAWFDGKLGIWPVGSFEEAQRTSVNRGRGEMAWKNKNMTRKIYRDMLENELIPALLTRWPSGWNKTIRIQQDGAKAHVKDNDEWLNEALEEVGLDARLYTQPPNSPDVNILDLGFFRAIQSANDEVSSDESQLITHVQAAYERYPRENLNRTWLTLQSVMNEIVDNHGNNDYKIPHFGKERPERTGDLPNVLEVTQQMNELLGEEQD
jgi:hypothetical protein